MSGSARWELVKEVFEGASARAGGERVGFLAEACADDQELRQQVERLLAHQNPSWDFLEQPIARFPHGGVPSVQSAQVFVPGDIVDGRFRVVRHLAAGGMGEVYSAMDLELRRDVALKVVRRRMAHDSNSVARLRREGLATARLNHPNIITLFEIGQDGEVLYIVSELLVGQTLRARLPLEGLPLRLAVGWATEIASALHAAHEEGIVHRDLKPDNVFVTQDGRIKLLDFGLSKLLAARDADSSGQPSPIDTAPHLVFGTPGYMAPEQLRGEAADYRADIFAFGVVLYEMLSGRRPGSGELRFNPGVPSRLRALVTRCLEPEPQNRFTSTTELRTALAAASRGSPPRWLLPLIAGVILVAGIPWLPPAAWPPFSIGDREAGSRLSAGAFTSTVAILPVINLSGDAHTEQVSAGITSTVATNIGSVAGITVTPQAESARYVAGDRDQVAALHDLDATLVLDLRLERTPNGYTMRAVLYRAGGTGRAWSNVYTGDVLAIERGILADAPVWLAASGVKGVTDVDHVRLMRLPTANAGALLDYFEGRRLVTQTNARPHAHEAVAAFQRSLAQDPTFVAARAGLSEAYVLRHQTAPDGGWLVEAARVAADAVAMDATSASAHVASARVKHQTGHRSDAIQELRLAVQLAPDSDDAHRLLGRLLADDGMAKEAVDALARAVALRPGYWNNHYTLGYVHYMAGRYSEAIPSLIRVTQLQPNYAEGYVILGASYHRAGAIELAIGNYEHAARIGPSALADANLGLIYYVDGRFEDALASYRSAIDRDPSSPVSQRSIGDVFAKLGRRVEAIASYEKAIELLEQQVAINPRLASSIALLALCEAKLGRRGNAERRAAEALALAEHDRGVLFTRAATYTILRQPEKALIALRSALENGYEPALASNDADLDSLRALPEFDRLLNSQRVPSAR